MHPRYAIRPARPADVPALPAIERAAGRLFRGHVPDALLDDVFEAGELEPAQRDGRLWVALHGGAPVGFAVVERLARDVAHLEEVDVDPAHGRRGVGARLVQAACACAAELGHAEITLTTFRDLAWNAPFYARLGFAPVALDAVRPEVAALFRAETARGLDGERRVVMARDLRDLRRPTRVRLRPTGEADLDFALALERHPENAGFVGAWTREEHAAAIASADREHWILERADDGGRAGFLIAFDLAAHGLGAYVKRVVVAEKSRGHGRDALAAFLRHASRDLGAGVAWLSVARDNARAIRAYEALGFREAATADRERLARAGAVGDVSERMRVMRIALDEKGGTP